MQMKLRKNRIDGDFAIYQIYDLDFDGMYALSPHSAPYDLNVQGNLYYHQWTVQNESINDYFQHVIPKTETAGGNIIPYSLKLTKYENNLHQLPDSITENFEAIPLGVRPLDWGENPNYISMETRTMFGGYERGIFPDCKMLDNTWDSQTQYYIDKNRVCARMFYLNNRRSFAVNKCYFAVDSSERPQRYQLACSPWNFNALPHYGFTDENGDLYNRRYTYDTDYIIQNTQLTYPEQFTTGYNIVQIFVRYTYSGREYYGIANIQMKSFAENTIPVAIQVVAWNADFWGDSIISGGQSGSGQWGNNNTAAGGNGTFSYQSDNRGSSDGTALRQEMTKRITATNTAAYGLYNIHRLTASEMKQVMQALYYTKSTVSQTMPDFIERCKNSVYNPLSAFLAINAIPHDLIALRGNTSILTAAGFDISESINHVTPPVFEECEQLSMHHIGEYDFNSNHVFDAFPDFAPYTKIKLHLPYIGVIDIDTNAVMYGKIAVDYFTDSISGNCTAFIWCCDKDGNYTYKYTASGNCAYSFPLFALSQDGSAVGKLIASGLNLAGGMLTGAGGLISAGVSGIGDTLLTAAIGKRETQSTGAFGGNVAILGDSMCYLEIIRPVWINPENYQKLYGIQSDLPNTLLDSGGGAPFDGYCQISAIDLEAVDATADEKTEIEQLLKNGVYIRGNELLT